MEKLKNEPKSGIAKRFLEAIDALGISGYRLHQEDIISSQSILTSIKNGKQNPTEVIINKFCNTYKVHKVWIYTGEGAMFNDRDQSNVVSDAPYINNDLVNVPLVPASVAASFVEGLDGCSQDQDFYGVMAETGERLNSSDYKVFEIVGDSMYPTIVSGSKVLGKNIPEGQWEMASGIVIIVYGMTLTIKRILKNDLYSDNRLILKADNPIHGEITIARSEIRGMWQATRIVSQTLL